MDASLATLIPAGLTILVAGPSARRGRGRKELSQCDHLAVICPFAL
jgi:hypothetical protein